MNFFNKLLLMLDRFAKIVQCAGCKREFVFRGEKYYKTISRREGSTEKEAYFLAKRDCFCCPVCGTAGQVDKLCRHWLTRVRDASDPGVHWAASQLEDAVRSAPFAI